MSSIHDEEEEEEELPPLQLSPTPSILDTFTMIFLDFDDTLIPSRIYRLFAHDLCIDIFELLSTTKMSKLQNTIIKTLQQIQPEYNNKSNGDNIYISIVSNASQKWLDYMLKGSKEHNMSSRLPILDSYLESTGISVVSASAKAYEFLQKQFGSKADEIFSNTLDKENKGNKWMWKYTAFSSIVSNFKRKTGMKCKRIISIGDGNDEEKACKHYTKTHKVESVHIRLLRGSTIYQLQSQWIYLQNNLYENIIKDDIINGNICKQIQYETYPLFHSYDLRKIDPFECDNNNHCTGRTHQLYAIQRYFHKWMDHLTTGFKAGEKKEAIKSVCNAIHKRIYHLDPESVSSRNFKLILIKAICKNKEFNDIFNAYYRKIQRRSDELNKLKRKRKSRSKRVSIS